MDRDADSQAADELRQSLLEAFRILEAKGPSGAAPLPEERELQLATAVLCLAILRADFESRQDEHRSMPRALERVLGLGPDDSARVLRHAEEQLARSRPLHEFVQLIDRGYSRERKRRVLESLWRVAFADAELQGHEEYLVRKIADLLHLSTADLIETKVAAREAFLREELS